MSTVKVLVVQPDETVTMQHVSTGSVTPWQRLVGGYIEAIPLGLGVQVIINEDGKAMGLAHNRLAYAMVRAMIEVDGRMLNPGDYIVGPAVFYGDPVGGEPTDVPDVAADLVRHAGIEIREESDGQE